MAGVISAKMLTPAFASRPVKNLPVLFKSWVSLRYFARIRSSLAAAKDPTSAELRVSNLDLSVARRSLAFSQRPSALFTSIIFLRSAKALWSSKLRLSHDLSGKAPLSTKPS